MLKIPQKIWKNKADFGKPGSKYEQPDLGDEGSEQLAARFGFLYKNVQLRLFGK